MIRKSLAALALSATLCITLAPRGGPLGPGESARLDFKAEEMNGVLKSLAIHDNGGKVTGSGKNAFARVDAGTARAYNLCDRQNADMR